MSEPFGRLRRFLRELKRRNVYKVAATYAVVGFVLIQAANLIFPALNIPSWAYSLVVVLILFGCPIALIMAWAFEMSPEGMRRTETPEGEESIEAGFQWLGLALVIVLAGGVWYATTGEGGGSRSETAATDSARADRSIAVLPFDNLSGTEEAEPFVNGIHDDLLTRLSNISDLKVISRTSVLPYRETELSLPAIADSLGVTWILEGGVQQAGERVQVNAQLIQAEEDVHRWAESYRRELTTENLFDVQTELTKKIAQSLEAELTPAETGRVERRPTDNLDSYRLYVEGRSHLKQRTEAGTRRAADYFGQAVRQDSSFALAWVGLADAASHRNSYGYEPLPNSLRVDPERAARRALVLDSTLAEAHATLGNLYMDSDLPRALRRLQRAVDLKPSYARAHHWLAVAYLTAGRVEQALPAAERAVALDPLSPINRAALGGVYYSSGRYEEALSEIRRAGDLAPDWAFAELSEGVFLSALGHQSEALDALLKGMAQSSNRSVYATALRAWPAVVHVRAGDTARAQELLASYEPSSPRSFDRAVVHAALGETREALNQAEIADSWFRVVLFRYDPVFQPLRGTSEYRAALREVNESLGLNPDGSLPDSVDVSFESQSDD